jgi:hypothetical protein
MNERIRQLSRQAADYANTYSDAGADVWFEIYNKKFAELIVKECVQVCSDRGANHDELYSAWADDCSKRIGKHFGVEE